MNETVTITGAGFGAPLGQEPPEWIELIPTGTFRLADGRGAYHLEDAAGVIARSFADDTKLPIDVDHGTQERTSSAAAGWITGMEVREGSVWARVEWTSKGRELVGDQIYRRISPTWLATKKGNRVTRILGAGLVNNPAIPALKPLTAAEQETIMKREEIAEALGLDADATEETILAAAAEMCEANERLGRIAKAAGADEVSDDMGEAAICAALKSGDPDPAKYVPIGVVDELRTEVASLKQDATDRRADELVAAAKASGKLTPAQEDWARAYAAKDADGFKAWADKAPAVVTAGRALAVTPAERRDGELSSVQSEIAAACGVSAEAFSKTEKAITAARDARAS